MGPVGDNVKPCKRGHLARRTRRQECVVCKKIRDDRYRLDARLAGKDADRQLRWWHKRMADPEFREKQRARSAAKKAMPSVAVARHLGVGMATARDVVAVRCAPLREDPVPRPLR